MPGTRLIILLFFTLNYGLSYSQEPVYQNYSTRNGLPSSQVYDIIQDDWGYLWFSTDHGLSRYDGYDFINYSTIDGLTDNTVFKMFKGLDGDLWCTTFNRTVFIISGVNPGFVPYEHNEVLESLPSSYILNEISFGLNESVIVTFINAHGYLEIHPDGSHISTLESNSFLSETHFVNCVLPEVETFCFTSPKATFDIPAGFLIDDTCRTQASINRLSSIHFEDTGKTIFCFEDSIYSVSQGGCTTKGLGYESIQMEKLDENSFWVSTMSGGVQIYSKDVEFIENLLPGKSVTNVFVDHENGTWISTLYNGVYHYKNREVKRVQQFSKKRTVIDLVTNGESIWASYQNGDVVRILNGKSDLIYEAVSSRPAHLFQTKGKNLLFTSDAKLLNGQGVNLCEVGANMGLYYFMDNGVKRTFIFQYSGLAEVLENGVVNIGAGIRFHAAVEYNNKLYLASKTGLYILDGSEVKKASAQNRSLDFRIDDLCVFNDQLVLGSRGRGVLFYSSDKVFKTITKRNGLTSDFISKLYVENNQTLWVCTNAGLNRIVFDESDFIVESVTYSDGLISNEVNAIGILNDTAWVGTQQGLNCFPISFLARPEKKVDYHLSLTKLLVNDALWFNDDLNFAYDQNRLEISFSAISFDESKELVYRYRLSGIDQKWKYSVSRSALYPSLPQGQYTFIVQVKGENNQWSSQSLELSIIVRPPYWKTGWFISSISILFVILLYLFFRFRILIYNRGLVREMLRQILKRIRKKTPHLIITEGNNQLKLETDKILYIKSDRNYLEIRTETGKHVIRETLNKFEEKLPDPLEFLRVRRSHIVRIDKITQKGKKHLYIGDDRIEVGATYLDQLDKIQL